MRGKVSVYIDSKGNHKVHPTAGIRYLRSPLRKVIPDVQGDRQAPGVISAVVLVSYEPRIRNQTHAAGLAQDIEGATNTSSRDIIRLSIIFCPKNIVCVSFPGGYPGLESVLGRKGSGGHKEH